MKYLPGRGEVVVAIKEVIVLIVVVAVIVIASIPLCEVSPIKLRHFIV